MLNSEPPICATAGSICSPAEPDMQLIVVDGPTLQMDNGGALFSASRAAAFAVYSHSNLLPHCIQAPAAVRGALVETAP